MWQYSEIRMDRKRTQKIDELRGIFKVLQLLSWILNTFMFLFWVSYICKKAHVHADLWRLWLGVHALLNWSEALSTSISTYWSWLSSHWYYALCSCHYNMSYQLHQTDGSCWPNSSYSKYSLETCASPFITLISFVYEVFNRFLVCRILYITPSDFADHD